MRQTARAKNQLEYFEKALSFSALEEFDLAKALLRLFLCLVRPAEILLAVFRENFISARDLLDHDHLLKPGLAPFTEV
jgi:hypothetical protein